jgi:protein-arginine kinase activator protein McsA
MHTTKICTKCQAEKSMTEFRNRKDSKDGKVSWCKPCFRQHEKDYWKSNSERRQKSRERSIATAQKVRNFVFSYLLEHPCEKCAENDPVVLEFDHLDPTDKLFNISEGLTRNGLATVQKEIAKCRVLCANCHRRHTAQQQGWWIASQ